MGGNIETFDIAFGEGVSLYVNEEGLFTCPPNRAIFATEEMAKAGYLSQLDYSKVVEMGDFYTVLNGDIVAVGFDPETGESRSLTDGETARVEGYFTVILAVGNSAAPVIDHDHIVFLDFHLLRPFCLGMVPVPSPLLLSVIIAMRHTSTLHNARLHAFFMELGSLGASSP